MKQLLPKKCDFLLLHKTLHVLHEKQYTIFHRMFIEEGYISISDIAVDADILIKSNICQKKGKMLKANFRISKIHTMYILADFPTYRGEDRVWYLLEDESILFSRNIPNCLGKSVLDIGSGSGVLGITASINGAREVTAIDISHRATKIGAFNAYLNGCKNMKFLCRGITDFKTVKPFDYIVFNPPFVPIPLETRYMLSGYGGQDGLGLVRSFFKQLHVLSHENTAISIISMSPGDKNISALERMFIDRYYGSNFEVVSTDIYGSIAPISVAYRPFKKEKNFEAWKKWLSDNRYTHMHYLFINAFPARSYEFKRILQNPKLEDIPFSGTWQAMYDVIQNSLNHAK